MTKEEKYLKNGGFGCPHCDHGHTILIAECKGSTNRMETYACKECSKEWTDVYTLTDVDLQQDDLYKLTDTELKSILETANREANRVSTILRGRL